MIKMFAITDEGAALVVRGKEMLENAVKEGYHHLWYLEDESELAWSAFTGGFRREFERHLAHLNEDETIWLINRINQYRTRDGYRVPGIEHLEVLEGYVKPARKHLQMLSMMVG